SAGVERRVEPPDRSGFRSPRRTLSSSSRMPAPPASGPRAPPIEAEGLCREVPLASRGRSPQARHRAFGAAVIPVRRPPRKKEGAPSGRILTRSQELQAAECEVPEARTPRGLASLEKSGPCGWLGPASHDTFSASGFSASDGLLRRRRRERSASSRSEILHESRTPGPREALGGDLRSSPAGSNAASVPRSAQ